MTGLVGRIATGRTNMKRLFLLILVVGTFGFWNIPVASAQFLEAGVQKLKTPIAAPDFVLKGLDGGDISLKEFRGKIVILNFFTTW
jgi:cytochrome c biogenesis protein CcmG/thiol:disulfide interchange protein DsbE